MRGIPETMRAAAIERFGGPELLELRTLPVPEVEESRHRTATRRPDMALEAGTQAPDFSLHTTPDQSVGLRDFRGRNVILFINGERYDGSWEPEVLLSFLSELRGARELR